jgi:hypothetical protein
LGKKDEETVMPNEGEQPAAGELSGMVNIDALIDALDLFSSIDSGEQPPAADAVAAAEIAKTPAGNRSQRGSRRSGVSPPPTETDSRSGEAPFLPGLERLPPAERAAE